MVKQWNPKPPGVKLFITDAFCFKYGEDQAAIAQSLLDRFTQAEAKDFLHRLGECWADLGTIECLYEDIEVRIEGDYVESRPGLYLQLMPMMPLPKWLVDPEWFLISGVHVFPGAPIPFEAIAAGICTSDERDRINTYYDKLKKTHHYNSRVS